MVKVKLAQLQVQALLLWHVYQSFGRLPSLQQFAPQIEWHGLSRAIFFFLNVCIDMSETDDQTYLKVWLEVANSKHINRKTLSVTIAVSFLIWTDMTPFQTFM